MFPFQATGLALPQPGQYAQHQVIASSFIGQTHHSLIKPRKILIMNIVMTRLDGIPAFSRMAKNGDRIDSRQLRDPLAMFYLSGFEDGSKNPHGMRCAA